MIKLKSLTSLKGHHQILKHLKEKIAPSPKKENVVEVVGDTRLEAEVQSVEPREKPKIKVMPLGPNVKVTSKREKTEQKKTTEQKQPSFLENVVFPFFRNDTRIENILAVKAGRLKQADHHSIETHLDPQKNYHAIIWHDVCDQDVRSIAELKNCLVAGQILAISWKQEKTAPNLKQYLAKHFVPRLFPPVADYHYIHSDGFEYHFYQKA